jgi:tetratricopeptide (TPR) repeat protein
MVLANARQLFAQGDLAGADKLFLKLKNSARYASDAYSGHAMVLLKREDFAGSLRFFEDALSKRIENADAYYGIGVILLRKGNSLGPAHAMSPKEYFELALRYNPRHAGASDEMRRIQSSARSPAGHGAPPPQFSHAGHFEHRPQGIPSQPIGEPPLYAAGSHVESTARELDLAARQYRRYFIACVAVVLFTGVCFFGSLQGRHRGFPLKAQWAQALWNDPERRCESPQGNSCGVEPDAPCNSGPARADRCRGRTTAARAPQFLRPSQ